MGQSISSSTATYSTAVTLVSNTRLQPDQRTIDDYALSANEYICRPVPSFVGLVSGSQRSAVLPTLSAERTHATMAGKGYQSPAPVLPRMGLHSFHDDSYVAPPVIERMKQAETTVAPLSQRQQRSIPSRTTCTSATHLGGTAATASHLFACRTVKAATPTSHPQRRCSTCTIQLRPAPVRPSLSRIATPSLGGM